MTLIYVDLVKDEPKSFDDWAEAFVDEYVATPQANTDYDDYVERFQPWRLAIISGDNQKELFRSSESYFNRADAEHAAEIGFGRGSNVYLREAEHGNALLRLASDGPAE